MTKQEKIKEAWEILIGKIGYSIRKDKIDENGYLQYETPNNLSVLHELCEKHPSRSDWEKWRPKSLQGIENNNGWITIESESDLPKETGHFWVCNKINNQIEIDYIDWDYESHAERWTEFNSHYQPIEKPKPPIY